MTSARLEAIYRYPVKGLSPEALDHVELTKGNLLPGDRAFAIEQGAPVFDPDAPKYQPKTKYLMLMRDEKLAQLETSYDEGSQSLVIARNGKQVARGQLNTPVGRGIIEHFFAAFMGSSLPGKPRVVYGGDHAFTDIAARHVSLINLASVRDIERVTGRQIDPMRFRGNFLVDGLEPWAEKNWIGKDIVIGNVRLRGRKGIVRCAATNVNLQTAERDINLPQLLLTSFGENICGLYLEVMESGSVLIGDDVAIQA